MATITATLRETDDLWLASRPLSERDTVALPQDKPESEAFEKPGRFLHIPMQTNLMQPTSDFLSGETDSDLPQGIQEENQYQVHLRQRLRT
jgi:hypothetical protein